MVVDAVGLVRGYRGAFRGIFGASDFIAIQKPHCREPLQSRLISLFGASGRVGGKKCPPKVSWQGISIAPQWVSVVIVRISFGLSVLLGCKKTILRTTTDTNKERVNPLIRLIDAVNQRERIYWMGVSVRENEPKAEMGDRLTSAIITVGCSVIRRDERLNTLPPLEKFIPPSVSRHPRCGYILSEIPSFEKKSGRAARRLPVASPPSARIGDAC